MKQVITLKDVEEIVRQGGSVSSLPADAIYTPSARDAVRDLQSGRGPAKAVKVPVPTATPAPAPAAASSAPYSAGAAPVALVEPNLDSPAEIETFFNSPAIHALKEKICDIGHRLWKRAYVDGNGGNISIRVTDRLVLCTPTMVSKGSLQPSDICLVDMDGNQRAGHKKRTSEVLMHLQIMKAQPQAKACCHAHPPHATAFAVAGIEPPTCMIPEYEVFCAVATAPYRTPGTPEMGKLISELADKHNTILMANHGVVTWTHNDVEEAYWRMEIIEAYCRTIVVASQLGKPLTGFSPTHLQDLLKIKQSLGFVDPRFGLKECELCDNSDWRPGVVCQAPESAEAKGPAADPQCEDLIKTITETILSKLKG
jgi:L-fuculose-phosphate aldolase